MMLEAATTPHLELFPSELLQVLYLHSCKYFISPISSTSTIIHQNRAKRRNELFKRFSSSTHPFKKACSIHKNKSLDNSQQERSCCQRLKAENSKHCSCTVFLKERLTDHHSTCKMHPLQSRGAED